MAPATRTGTDGKGSGLRKTVTDSLRKPPPAADQTKLAPDRMPQRKQPPVSAPAQQPATSKTAEFELVRKGVRPPGPAAAEDVAVSNGFAALAIAASLTEADESRPARITTGSIPSIIIKVALELRLKQRTTSQPSSNW